MIFPKAEPEEQVTGDQEQEPKQGQQHKPRIVCAIYQVEEGIILKKRDGNDVGSELQNALAVNGDGVLAEFPAAIGEDVHKLQAVNGKETDTGWRLSDTGI